MDQSILINNTNGINKEINVSGVKLETVAYFKYLSIVISDKDSGSEIRLLIPHKTTSLARLKPIWEDNSSSSNHAQIRVKKRSNYDNVHLEHQSCPCFRMHVRHGRSQQSYTEEEFTWKCNLVSISYAEHNHKSRGRR